MNLLLSKKSQVNKSFLARNNTAFYIFITIVIKLIIELVTNVIIGNAPNKNEKVAIVTFTTIT